MAPPTVSKATPATALRVIDLGRDVPYAAALDVQRSVNQAVIDGDAPPTVLLLEHPPVITVTNRPGARDHLLASPDRLAELGIAVVDTDRGGDITYHGPGQLVAYPILPLSPLGLNLSRYMRLLERVVIDTVASFGVTGLAEAGATGVWVDGAGPADTSAKLCAMGVRVRRNTTLHGLALNITTDLAHFDTIVPCGLAGRAVTALSALLGERCPAMGKVKSALSEQLGAALGLTLEPATPPAAWRLER
ncbi:MAG: lipoyl(octanoyl) transferase LipB [Planctomycetota bacterium]